MINECDYQFLEIIQLTNQHDLIAYLLHLQSFNFAIKSPP